MLCKRTLAVVLRHCLAGSSQATIRARIATIVFNHLKIGLAKKTGKQANKQRTTANDTFFFNTVIMHRRKSNITFTI